MTKNQSILNWVEEMSILTKPADVVWIDGSDEQIADLRQKAVDSGIIKPLCQDKLPGCAVHRTAVHDAARSEQKTFICSPNEKDVGPTNNWCAPDEMYDTLHKLFDGVMRGRTMYVIPFSMGPVGSKLSKVGIKITDSIFVVLNTFILARCGKLALDSLGDESNDWVRGMHSTGQLDDENRYIAHFPLDNAVWSINSGSGGNALLTKKCIALRNASYQGKSEGWLAEHMLIIGVERPEKDTVYIAAALPSHCGKTNLAMLVPPEGYAKNGYKVWCVSDDVAWLKQGTDGKLWAINPENGFFGVAPDTNNKTNPNAISTVQKNTIFTNVVHNLDDNSVWWEGLNDDKITNAVDWKGNPWNSDSSEKGAHTNARFTAPASDCPCISPEHDNAEGVPISAFIFGGKRAKTLPLVYQAFDWKHGVFVGSIVGTEVASGLTGSSVSVRRDPMAMLPFCGYNMADYFGHWLKMGDRLGRNAPKVFNVNWFRTNDEGNFVWPGYGENMRVLDWIIERVCGNKGVVETPIGYEPKPEDINIDGLEDAGITLDVIKELLSVDKVLWKEEVNGIKQFYTKFGDRLPEEMKTQLVDLEKRLL
ncbi:MAG: phosphoenolpyruvate carboxykinase (GTP) [Oscillospiraceae bacterium]|nr:phosphoenolpyruvate carboxykinase (GTP) [Oscillospiraceae bacterium]